VFANVSAGIDRKANSRPVRATGGLLQGLQRRVALEALRESSCSFWTDLVAPQTASTGVEAGVKKCQRALTQKQTLWGGGAHQLGDLRLLEDGGERGGALNSDRVASETASEGWGGDGERVGVSMGIDTKANTRAAAHHRLVICVSLRMAASAEAPSSPIWLYPRL
jgi:hypothetical protein